MSAIPADAIDPEVANQIQNDLSLKYSEEISHRTAVLCSNKDRLDRIDHDFDLILEYFKENDYIEAYFRWTHWRKGLNDKLPFDIGWLRNNTSIRVAENKNEDNFETNPWGEPGKSSIYSQASKMQDGDLPSKYTERWPFIIKIYFELVNNDIDLLASVGTTMLVSEGTFTISRSGDLFDITGTVNHKIEDTFDFNPGETFLTPPGLALKLGKQNVEANDLNLLELCRGAKSFKQNAYWQKELKAEGTLAQLKSEHSPLWKWTFIGEIAPF